MGTQWRMGVAGATGLDYVSLQSVMRLLAIPRKSWPEVFADIRDMESAALREMQGVPEEEDGRS